MRKNGIVDKIVFDESITNLSTMPSMQQLNLNAT